MHSFQTLLIQTVAVACFAAGPAVCPAANDPAAAASSPPAQTNASTLNVPRPPRHLEEDELRGLLTAALNQRRSEEGAEWELHLTRPWTPLVVPDEPLTAEILEPALNRITSSSILRFELRAGQKTLGAWQSPVQAHLWRQTLVAHSSLQRGQLLREADFAHERWEPLAELPAQIPAYELAETLPAGAPLIARAIRLKPVLSRGQLADAIIRDGAMIISLKVEVLEEGVPGQLIRVRNPQSRREFRGKVLDEQTVAIPL